MRFYELTFDRSDWYKYSIKGERPYSLPWLLCDGCGGPYTIVGEAYPGVDPARSPLPAGALEWPSVDLTTMTTIRQALRWQVPPSARLTPGTRLGPFRGTFSGRPLDVCWHQPWEVFFRAEAVERLRDLGVAFPRVYPAELAPKKTKRPVTVPALLDPEVGLGVTYSETGMDEVRPPCPVCGEGRGQLREPVIEAGSYDPACGDLMRARNMPVRYVVTERFHEAAVRATLTGVRFVPLRVVRPTAA